MFSVISITQERFVGFGFGKNYMKGVDLSYLHNEPLIYYQLSYIGLSGLEISAITSENHRFLGQVSRKGNMLRT